MQLGRRRRRTRRGTGSSAATAGIRHRGLRLAVNGWVEGARAGGGGGSARRRVAGAARCAVRTAAGSARAPRSLPPGSRSGEPSARCATTPCPRSRGAGGRASSVCARRVSHASSMLCRPRRRAPRGLNSWRGLVEQRVMLRRGAAASRTASCARTQRLNRPAAPPAARSFASPEGRAMRRAEWVEVAREVAAARRRGSAARSELRGTGLRRGWLRWRQKLGAVQARQARVVGDPHAGARGEALAVGCASPDAWLVAAAGRAAALALLRRAASALRRPPPGVQRIRRGGGRARGLLALLPPAAPSSTANTAASRSGVPPCSQGGASAAAGASAPPPASSTLGSCAPSHSGAEAAAEGVPRRRRRAARRAARRGFDALRRARGVGRLARRLRRRSAPGGGAPRRRCASAPSRRRRTAPRDAEVEAARVVTRRWRR